MHVITSSGTKNKKKVNFTNPFIYPSPCKAARKNCLIGGTCPNFPLLLPFFSLTIPQNTKKKPKPKVLGRQDGGTGKKNFRLHKIMHAIRYMSSDFLTKTGNLKNSKKVVRRLHYQVKIVSRWKPTGNLKMKKCLCVCIDKENDVWVPKPVFDVCLTNYQNKNRRVRVVGGPRRQIRSHGHTILKKGMTYLLGHYTNEEGLKGIWKEKAVLSGPGCYGDFAYLTATPRLATPQQIGPSIYDGAGIRLANEGRISCCVRLQIKGDDLMKCDSASKNHIGYCYDNTNRNKTRTLKRVAGKTAKKQKITAKKAGKGPDLIFTGEMKPQYMMYQKYFTKNIGWRKGWREVKMTKYGWRATTGQIPAI